MHELSDAWIYANEAPDVKTTHGQSYATSVEREWLFRWFPDYSCLKYDAVQVGGLAVVVSMTMVTLVTLTGMVM